MKKLLYIAALAGTFALTGCDDFLTPDNKSAVTDKDFFTSKDGFPTIVNDVYATLGTRGSDKMFNAAEAKSFFSAGTDMYMDARRNCNEVLHRWQNIGPEASIPKKFYEDAYDAIRKCYTIDYYAPNVSASACSEEDKARMIDECHTVACFYYYLLVNKFGGVPLVTEYATSAISGYPRASAADVYAYIITELERIVANNKLVASTATKGGGQISMEAAKAILAKTYLAAAWDLNKSEYFAKAAAIADEVIAGRELTTPFAELWAADCSGDDDAEFIWDVEYDYDATSDKAKGNRWQSLFSNYYGGKEDGMKNGDSSYAPTIHTLKYFEKGDLRYDATFAKMLYIKKNPWDAATNDYAEPQFKEMGGNYFGMYDGTGTYVGIYYQAWYETDADVAAWIAEDTEHREHAMISPMAEMTYNVETFDKDYKTKVVDYEVDGRLLSYTCAPCCKFDDSVNPNYDAGRSFRDLHIITLPEMFFVAAEAYHKAGNDTEATARLNSVRKRAGLAPIALADVVIEGLAQPDMIDWILKESACEMFGNGYRNIDLRRTGKLVQYNDLWNPQLSGTAVAAIGERTLWPIPQAAIDANKLLTDADQNPGY